MRLIITAHAQEQMLKRGIDEEQVRMVIQRGSKIKQTDGLKAVFGYIGVCYKIRGDIHIVKTVIVE